MLSPLPAAVSEPVSTEEVLGTYSDALWRIYDELDEFAHAAAVSLDCADESVAASYREHCVPTTFCSFADVVYCTDSWTAEYDVPAELAEMPDAQITITSEVGDELYIRSDTDSVYVRRADGAIDCYTGLDGRYMLESLWYWAAAMSVPVEQELLVIAPDESRALSDIIAAEEAVYWYVSDWSVGKIWAGEGETARTADDPDVENGVFMPCGEGMCFVACADADGRAIGRRMILVTDETGE